MRFLSFLIMLIAFVSCAENLVEADHATSVYVFELGDEHHLQIIGNDIKPDMANSLFQSLQEKAGKLNVWFDEPKEVNRKSWGDIEFSLSKKIGYSWNNIGSNSIIYQSYAVHYVNKALAGVDVILVNQFPVNKIKGIQPFSFDAYDLSQRGFEMTCVRAKLYGHESKVPSKMVLMHNELRIIGKGACELGSNSFTEIGGLTTE